MVRRAHQVFRARDHRARWPARCRPALAPSLRPGDLGLALLLRYDARPLRTGHDPGRPLPHRRTPRPRRNGRGLSRRRPEAWPTGCSQVSAPFARRRPGAPGAIPQRGSPRPPDLAQERLPHVRRGRRRRTPLSHDGVRGRRGSGVPAAAHRTAARRQGPRHRAPTLLWPRRRARARRASSRSEAGQRDDRWQRPGAHHRLRSRRDRRRQRSDARGHAGLHGAGTVDRTRRDRPKRRLRARPGAVRSVHGPPRLRRADARRAHAATERAGPYPADGGRQRPGPHD